MASRAISVAIAALMMAAAGAVGAQTTYDYTGAPMGGTVVGSFIGPDGEGATYSYCCTTLDGSMTLSAPLAPNLNNALVDPIAFTFGFSTIGGPIGAPAGSNPGGAISATLGGPSQQTNIGTGIYAANLTNSAEWLQTNVGGPQGSTAPFAVSTNSAGQITSWNLQAGNNPAGAGVDWTVNVSSSTADSLGFQTFNHGPNYTLSNDTPGSWSAVQTNSVPEIDAGSASAALTLLGAAVAILCGRRRRVIERRLSRHTIKEI